MYQQYHTRRHRHSTHSHQHIIGSSSMHSFPPAIVSPVLLCQKLPSPIRVQERSRIGLRITTVYAYSVYDYGRLRGVLGVCVLRLRSGTVFPSCANIVLRPFIHILRYAYRLSFLRTYPGSLLATNQFLQPSPIQLKSPPSFYLILHVYCTFFIVRVVRPAYRSRCALCHTVPLVTLPSVPSRQCRSIEPSTITVVVLSLKGSPHCLAHSCRLHYQVNRALRIILFCIDLGDATGLRKTQGRKVISRRTHCKPPPGPRRQRQRRRRRRRRFISVSGRTQVRYLLHLAPIPHASTFRSPPPLQGSLEADTPITLCHARCCGGGSQALVPTQHKAVGVIERGRVLFFPCNQGEVRDGSGLHTQKARRERIDLPEDPVALNSPGTGTQGKNDAGISATREACAASPAARALIPMGCGAVHRPCSAEREPGGLPGIRSLCTRARSLGSRTSSPVMRAGFVSADARDVLVSVRVCAGTRTRTHTHP